MVSSKATTVQDYLASLPEDRRAAISAVRDVILKNLPQGFRESMQYGMIGYGIPLERYPVTYNGQPLGLAALASQKQYMSVYLMTVYGDPETEKWFAAEYKKAGKKLDMGKSCVRFKKLEDLPLELIGKVIARVGAEEFIARYEQIRATTAGGKKEAAKKNAVKTAVAVKKAREKKAPAKKKAVAKSAPAAKKAAGKKTLAKKKKATSK